MKKATDRCPETQKKDRKRDLKYKNKPGTQILSLSTVETSLIEFTKNLMHKWHELPPKAKVADKSGNYNVPVTIGPLDDSVEVLKMSF